MGGQTTNTTTQESGLSNPAMNAAATTIGNQLNTQLAAGVKPFTGSLAPDLSGQTMAGVNSLMGAAGNTGGLNAANNWATGTVNSGGYNPALMDAQSGIQSYLAESTASAPGFAALKDQVATDVNATMQGSGRFGSTSHANDLAQGLAGLEYQNYSDRLARQMSGNQALAGIGQTAMGNAAGAAGMVPSLYQASLMPASAQLQAGQIMDAQALAKAQDAERLFDQSANAGWNNLQRGASIFSGAAPISGTTQSSTSPATPWWQSLAGGAIGLGSMFL